MTREQAVERAHELTARVPGGRGYYGRLWDSIADELLAVERETLELCKAMRDALELAEGHLAEGLHDKAQHPIGRCPTLDYVRFVLHKARGEQA